MHFADQWSVGVNQDCCWAEVNVAPLLVVDNNNNK